MNFLLSVIFGVVETAYPERCVLCGADSADVPFAARGERVRGLRWWDRSHLCAGCQRGLGREGPRTRRGDRDAPVVRAASVTSPDLVRAVGALKYHGVRGLAWPLAAMLARALPGGGEPYLLVPVPLHRRRSRTRGFNQAEVLARLAGRYRGREVQADRLVRSRATAQQARFTDDAARRTNLAGAFSWRGDPPALPVVLVDDIVTSGATAVAAAVAVRAVGGRVLAVAALGVAVGDR